MTYADITTTDLNFTDFTSFGDYNSSMNFFIGNWAILEGKIQDLNDNEYVRIRAYSFNEKN